MTDPAQIIKSDCVSEQLTDGQSDYLLIKTFGVGRVGFSVLGLVVIGKGNVISVGEDVVTGVVGDADIIEVVT